MTTQENEIQGGLTTTQVRGVVKWFNAVKGYGFLTPDDGSRDAFLHVTVLRQVGREDIKPGATVTCEATRGPKGLQVLKIVDLDLSTSVETPPSPPSLNGHDHAPVAPAAEDAIGSPKAGPRVDGRRPAHRLPHGHRDERVADRERGPRAPVERVLAGDVMLRTG